ncbi:MAG: ATPase [Bacteroidetes bacterium]|nr:ATPase [Bacteroidota bacterium]
MILVADSGSTKCDWLIAADGEMIETKTMGFNPFFHTSELIAEQISANPELSKIADDVDAVFFYGAGCSSEDRDEIVRKALKSVFTNAIEIVVDHDLTGAALATCGNNPGIACILGTGSNSCYFDGNMVSEVIPALGYILGDEGSGSYFGKQLLSNYLYKRLPKDLSEEFYQTFGLGKEDILTSVYNKPNPNVYLASFMRFVSDHREHPYVREMIYKGIRHFAEIHILCYEQANSATVNFVGSVAYYFHEVVKLVADDLGFTVGSIVKKPITSLAEYHLQRVKS